jgi:hypothetical protein
MLARFADQGHAAEGAIPTPVAGSVPFVVCSAAYRGRDDDRPAAAAMLHRNTGLPVTASLDTICPEGGHHDESAGETQRGAGSGKFDRVQPLLLP